MAQMIGARRNSVSLVANTLQQANFIRYSRDTSRSPTWMPQQNLVRMLRDGQGPIRTIASSSLPVVSLGRSGERKMPLRNRIRTFIRIRACRLQ